MHQTISRTRAALPSVIDGPLSDFHSLIKSNIWYLRSESARDPKRSFGHQAGGNLKRRFGSNHPVKICDCDWHRDCPEPRPVTLVVREHRASLHLSLLLVWSRTEAPPTFECISALSLAAALTRA